MEEEIYDFVIIGSGMSGLECAYILANEGYKVVVLEKNHQIGGNLQVFSRDKCVFDTGVHYIGSLDEGECLNKFFKYFGLMDLKWKRMDDDCVDLIRFSDGTEYKIGQGYKNFKSNLYEYFPDEKEVIDTYCTKIQHICTKFPLYNLDLANQENYLTSGDDTLLSENTAAYLDSITDNERLKNVLAGTNALYAGVKSKSPLYIHALIINSYITGSYRLKDGGSQIAITMTRAIKKLGGKVLKRKEVIGANYNDDKTISEVKTSDGSTYKAKNYISNMHPAVTIDVFGEDRFIKAYRNRIKKLENTISSFIMHIVLKEDSFEYLNYNIYQNGENVWDGINYSKENWPDNYFLCTPATSKNEKYAECLSAMTYMHYDEVRQWENTSNTIANPGERGPSYEAFKKEKEEIFIKKLEEKYPDIRSKIKSIHSTTPLTFRDYIGDKEGSLYGILKDSNNPVRSLINPSTKIPNLYLTGQNLILHGILGATIGAFVTCFNFVDKKKLMEKVLAV